MRKMSARQLVRVIKEAVNGASASDLMEEIRQHYAVIKELAGQLADAPDISEFLEDYSMAGASDDPDEMLEPVASELIALTEEVWSALDRDLRSDIKSLS